MIQGHGNASANVILLADGGTSADMETNYALSGYAQTILYRAIANSFHLKETYQTCLIKEKIHFRAEGKIPYYEREETLQKIPFYAPLVLEEIQTIKPNLIIPLGELGFRFLTGMQGIRKFRGSVVMSTPELRLERPIKILPILGPEPYLNQEYKMQWISRIDFAKVPLYATTDVMPTENRINVWICRSAEALRNFFQRSYHPNGVVNFDIETFFGIPTCISFCFDGFESVCIPFLDKSVDTNDRMLMIQSIARLLASPIRKINQNIKYDWKILERFGFQVNNVWGDPGLAASVLYPELPKNLGFLNSLYTDIPYFKDEGKVFNPEGKKDKEKFYLYNAKDSVSSYQILHKQLEELDETGTRGVYDNLMKCLPVYRQMEINGLRYDDEARRRMLAKYQSLFNVRVIKLQRMAENRDFSPMSPVQCDRLIFNELGFEKGRYVKGTDEESLEYLIVFGESKRSPIYGKEILKEIINCRKLHKVIEYLETVPYPDGRWRCEYNLGGTETGRTSAGKSLDEIFVWEETKKGYKLTTARLGRSFQTIAKHGFIMDGEQYGKEIRTIFVPSPGYSFVEIDLSGAEARVDQVLAGNFNMSVFDHPGIHKLTGSWLYNCKPEEINKKSLQYYYAKTVRHAGERNMKADRLVLMASIPLREAKQLLDTFHSFQPEIRNVYHRDVRECINATRTLIAPNGRRRQFLDRVDEHLYNEAISQLPQCIVSDQTKFSLPKTFEETPWALLINEAHDGTLAEVPTGREAEYARVYKRNIETPIDFRKCSLRRDYELIIPCEASWSRDSWYDMKDLEL